MVWFDTYAAGVSLLCSALFECIAVIYCYGNYLMQFFFIIINLYSFYTPKKELTDFVAT